MIYTTTVHKYGCDSTYVDNEGASRRLSAELISVEIGK